MKSIALLLSIIVLVLTTVPCCALEERDTHAHQKEQKQEQHQCSEQQKDECCKDCSPFYVCGTCIGFTPTAQPLFVFTVSVKPVQHHTFYLPIELSPIYTLIWQPPKLS
ncbi:hypothetical protein [Pedobacter sp. UC225_65]|uniref:hypothetical protein n=1 Tax=Pedobacter sp. UC225_65 TaxID=3350173 RepID=UPI00366DB8C4